MSVYKQAQLYQHWQPTSRLRSQTQAAACLEACLDGCLRLRVPSTFLPVDGELALGHLALSHRSTYLLTQLRLIHIPLKPCCESRKEPTTFREHYPDASPRKYCRVISAHRPASTVRRLAPAPAARQRHGIITTVLVP